MPLAGAVHLPLAVLYPSDSPFGLVHHPYHMAAFLLADSAVVYGQYATSTTLMLFGCLGLVG